MIRNVQAQQNIFTFDFHDLSAIFYDSGEAVFTDYIHINAVSNKKVARTICDQLVEKIKKRQGKD